MNSHEGDPRPPLVLDNLDALTDLAVLAIAFVAIGSLGGCLFAIALRRRDLAWTWSALALCPLALWACLALPGMLDESIAVAALALISSSSLAAAAWGLRADLEDRRAGGDREARARERRGIFDGLRRRWRERRGGPGHATAAGIPLGRTARGRLASVPRGSAASGSHVLIPGATGSGKTTSLASLLVDHVARSGSGAVVLEAKTDSTLRDSAEAAARLGGRAFHLFAPNGPDTYDPLAHGSADERSERLIAVEARGSTDADFYRQAASPFLRLVIRTLDASALPVTLATVADHCDPDNLENLAASVGDLAAAAEVSPSVRGLRSDQQRAIAGLRARLENLASSDFARQGLDPTRAGARTFDLRAAIEAREVAYFRFDTDRTGNVGRAIAQMVLLDLGAAASALMGNGVGTFIAIDEFGALEAPALDRLYARGRAAGFSVAVGTQTLADLRAAGAAVRERVGATISALVCHRIGEQADAEWVAELIGAVPTWQSTIRTDGLGHPTSEGTRTRGYRFEVNPSELQRLRTGEAYIARLDRDGHARAARAQVVPPWQRLAPAAAPT